MSIDELTIKEAKVRMAEADELRKVLGGEVPSSDERHDWVGKNVFIRTVTHHYTGRVLSVTKEEIVLDRAAWIADDGRFADSMRDGFTGDRCEIEPWPEDAEVAVNRGAVLDWSVWPHDLPRTQK